ncbi:methyl-accepting chemotaxis protein McpS [mine drainage metagenome]|uniref:Methyl-accepting chemotaxis protein McpS n=1 Tax=mine drainage metagenome TaxID=410659 RepID=A0A1J5T8L3_9ZZZZ
MSIQSKMLATVFSSQLVILFLAMSLGPSSAGWAAGIGVALVSLAILVALIKSSLLAPLEKLRGAIQTVKMEGNLALRLTGSNGVADDTARTLNELLDNFQSIVGKVMFNSSQVASSALSLENMVRQVTTGSLAQQDAAEAASQAIEEMIGNVQSIAENARRAADNARESCQLSSDGARIAQNAAGEIERVAQAFEDSAISINHLGERTQLINGIAAAIHDIADQTNLLALNAAIEAARAGEYGRGFAVVADEVRKLAERTSTATKEISAMISSIQAETATTIGKVQSGTALAQGGAALARQAADALTQINRSSQSTLDESTSIATAITEQTVASELVGKQMHHILTQAENNASVVEKMQEQATHLDHLAVNLKELDNVFKLGDAGMKGLETHGKVPAVVQAAAHAIGETLERAIASKRISETDLFDENYERIPDVEPPKYHTRFDRLTDELFPAIQEPLLQQHPEFVYAGAVDRNGYFPTHNKKFSAPITGDIKQDTIHSRTKRIFSDPVGKRCGSHNQPFLIQTYRRDTGEVVHDISAPIFVHGRRWGGFRIGYRA